VVIARIHAAPVRLVYEFAGAGSLALAWLHLEPGSSRTVLEATDRYCAASLAELLGAPPAQAVSAATARAMAARALDRARSLAPDGDVLGLACTAAIATDRTRKGADRAFVCALGEHVTVEDSLELPSGDRAAHEEAVSGLVITVLGQFVGE
jgi:nicotinamide mononucleotide (NMN) deamidase PncC